MTFGLQVSDRDVCHSLETLASTNGEGEVLDYLLECCSLKKSFYVEVLQLQFARVVLKPTFRSRLTEGRQHNRIDRLRKRY